MDSLKKEQREYEHTFNLGNELDNGSDPVECVIAVSSAVLFVGKSTTSPAGF